MVTGILDKIPDDQEIVHISHILDRIQLVDQTLFQLFGHWLITFLQTLKTQFVQILPRGISFWHVIPRQLGHTKFNLNIAAHRNLMRILQSFRGIRK